MKHDFIKGKLCRTKVEENIIAVETGQPLTLPLATLNKSCKFRKMYNKFCGLSEEQKAKKREYNQRPEVKAKLRMYRQRPDVKIKIRENCRRYYQRHKIRINRNHRRYYQRPEVKARFRAYYQKSKIKNK